MREVPECLSRRYRALDELIKELTRSAPQGPQPDGAHTASIDAGIQLLCDFWNIVKEDPAYDLVNAIQQRLGLVERVGDEKNVFRPENVTCYMAGKCYKKDDGDDQRRETINKIRKICSGGSENAKCCASKSTSPSGGSDVLPLSKVLCNLKEAASFDKKCNARINELMDTQKVLEDQIQHLEHREKEGVQLLKQADCMWTCMEDTYNKKINESLERQKALIQQLKEVEASTAKWRKNKKDLDLQLVDIAKCHEEIKDKINQKNSDLKCMDVEIEDFKKRIESNKKDMETVKKSFVTKKQASEAKITKISTELSRLQKVVTEEQKYKSNKEQEGAQYVQEARQELQKICKVLLKKKIENEGLKAEKEALNFELDVLKQTCDQCRDKCKNRQLDTSNEIAKVEKQIKEFKVRCTRCHECIDTVDIRKFCTDCPRCIQERDCILEKDHCTSDHTMDCVCTSVKHKFLENVFDNMYTVLERQIKTDPGKAVADAVLNCLKRSRNGKLDMETRSILQDFILKTIKKNLNLTIVGGAVKTRCEMDPETYEQLILCLKQVKVVKPPKEDKATPAKKDSCRRWGGVSECNCPKGPKACICLKKAPPPPQEPSPCPAPTQDKENESVVKCPHKETAAFRADSAMHAVPSLVGADIAAWGPEPCKDQTCRFSKNMRAAQCVLGPESLVSLPERYKTAIPQVPEFQDLEELMTCKCGRAPTKPCNCQDRRSQPRERIIEEVMGRYGDMPPIAKVNIEDEVSYAVSNRRTNSVQNDVTLEVSGGCACRSINKGSNSTVPLMIIHTRSINDKRSDKNSSKNELVTLYKNSRSNEFTKNNVLDSEMPTGMAVILQPQFTATCSKNVEDEDDSALPSKESHEKPTIDNTEENLSTTNTNRFGRNVCDTVKELMQDIIVPEVENNVDPEIEYVTVDSLMKEIASLTKITEKDNSDVTVNEVEVKIESLKGSKTNKQDIEIQEIRKHDKSTFPQQMKLQFTFKNVNQSTAINKRVTKNIEFPSKLSKNSLSIRYNENIGTEKKLQKSHLIRDRLSSIKVKNDSTKLKCTNLTMNNRSNVRNYKKSEKPRKSIYSKQLKAGIIKPCGKVTCRSLWDEAKEKANRSYSLLEKEIGKETYSEIYPSEKFEQVPSVQIDVLSEAQNLSGKINLLAKSYDSKNVTFGEDIKGENPKERIKVIVNDSDHSNDQFTNLKTTESGKLALELDEKVIALIDEKCIENPNLFVSLDETDSGNCIINFSPQNTMRKKQRIAIKKTPSGTRLLEVHKKIVDNLMQNDNKIIDTKANSFKNREKNACQAICDCEDHLQKKECISTISGSRNAPDQNNCLSHLQRFWIEGTKEVTLKVIGRNGISKEIKGTLIRDSSGSIGIDVTNISTFGDVTFKSGECPALLTPMASGTFLLQISPESDFNVSLRRSTVGGIILTTIDPVSKITEHNHVYETKTKNEFFKVKVKSSNKLVEEPPAVLKMTPSHNYTFVLDKEYEKPFRQSIDECIGDNSECFVGFDETMSGNFLVILDHNVRTNNENQALLTKSPSGNIKMVVNDPMLESSDNIYSPKNTLSLKAFTQLFDKLPPSNRQINIANLKEAALNKTKSCSDSYVYDKVKIKLPDRKDLLEPSATLTRTESGQCAVVLNKESKKDFVNRLRNYLSDSQGLIPIKRTVSGEITIALNSDDENNCAYESLKFTPSGNIYVTVDEKVIEGMVNNVKCSEVSYLGGELSKHMIESIKNPVNKSVTTTCNAKPECCSCDEAKCVCKELQLNKYLQGIGKCSGLYLKSQNYCDDLTEVRNNPYGGCNISDPQKCKEPCCVRHNSRGRSKSPHIVIKPCDCGPMLRNNPRSEEYCYFVEDVCPYHIDKYETVPKELLHISGVHKKFIEKRNQDLIGSKVKTKNNVIKDCSWDSLNYLPPQLPRFLQDVNFR